MCIIIDTNILNEVFNPKNQNHLEFKPVYEWIINGKGKVVYGGTKYITEIPKKYLEIFKLLKTVGKAHLVNSESVDIAAASATEKIEHPDFDDQH